MADVALVGLPERRQVHPHLPGVGGQAQDRRLPVHHPRAQPRRGPPRRRLRVRRGRHPRSHRRGERGQGPRPPLPAPHRTGPGPGAADRPGRWHRRHDLRPARRTGPHPARGARGLSARPRRAAPPGGRLACRPRARVPRAGRRPASPPPPTTASSSTSASPPSPAPACPTSSGAWPTRCARPVPSSPRSRASSCTARCPRACGSSGRTTAASAVVGRQAERAVALSDLTNLEALDYAHARLKKLGVDKALVRAGAREGDTVRIGEPDLRVRGGLTPAWTSWPRSARPR